jgi:hypothetical protein
MKEKKIRQYRSNQGRSPRQMENNYKIMGWSIIALVGTIVIAGIVNFFN